MKLVCGFVLAFVCVSYATNTKLKCNIMPPKISAKWNDMAKECIKDVKLQVRSEIGAAMTYLAMGAHFARDTVNRPGFSKFFLENANEERQHAIKIIEYLLMRGEFANKVSSLLDFKFVPSKQEWTDASEALADALNLEVQVTGQLLNISNVCEKAKVGDESEKTFNDYHLVDYITNDFLDEQYKGQRDLVGKITNLDKMMASHGPLGEFLFDKKLLNGEL